MSTKVHSGTTTAQTVHQREPIVRAQAPRRARQQFILSYFQAAFPYICVALVSWLAWQSYNSLNYKHHEEVNQPLEFGLSELKDRVTSIYDDFKDTKVWEHKELEEVCCVVSLWCAVPGLT